VSAGKTILSFRWPVDLRLTVASHGWAYLAPWYWDPETGRLGRQERIGDRLGRIEVAQRDPVSMVVLWQGFDAAALPEIQRRRAALALRRLGAGIGDGGAGRRRGTDCARRWPLAQMLKSPVSRAAA
jgi:hypothetical protein